MITKHRATRRKTPQPMIRFGFTLDEAAAAVPCSRSSIDYARRNPKVLLTASIIPEIGPRIPISEMLRVYPQFAERLGVAPNYGQIALVMQPVRARTAKEVEA